MAASEGATGVVGRFFGAKNDEVTPKLIVTHLNIVFYALCFWMCQPVLPFLSEQLGASPVVFGYLQTSFSVIQLIGAPIVGRLCDTYGPRLAIQIACVGTALSYLLLGMSHNLTTLFLSRIPTITMQTMHGAQAFVTLMSSESSRVDALGRLSISYGLGMIIGSPIGGLLSSRIGYFNVALLAGFLQVLMVPINLAYLPSAAAPTKEAKDGDAKEAGGFKASLAAIGKLLAIPKLRSIIIFSTLVGLGLSIYRSSISMSAKDVFALEASDLAFLQTIGAILAVVSTSVLVGRATALLGEIRVIGSSVVIITVSLIGYSMSSQYWQLLCVAVPLGLSGAAMYTLTTSMVTSAASEKDSATAIGFTHASRSFCGIIAPTLSGFMLQYGGLSALALTAAAFVGLAGITLLITNLGASATKKQA